MVYIMIYKNQVIEINNFFTYILYTFNDGL
jgi:hypothetical protein